ncbi:MAG: RidA family protein [Thermoplasmata archaeon]
MARSVRRSPRKGPTPGARVRYASGTPWEATVGYCRALRVGGHVYVSGTTATNADGVLVGRDDPYRQTVQALDNIEKALRALGSRPESIVRVRTFVTDLARVDKVTRALGERFRPIRPTMTLVAVRGLLDPAMLVEIEVEADDLPDDGGRSPGSAASPTV